ncbi:MAG TPA: UDP-N-acetylmuramoyl-tripeptide--D-alanyl-D-alanine ligase [Ignavibacteria bacterium]|nr:UDP-N-acetylmuramoyl-tripeptide--D-alanyl-D-alanine ligase [Bacteroidota bacterium]HRI84574.1 UDP-N-acetylmuramoyl-tripeptide--D-alanyl-D-alanine ligase [Ignavibacteria bacterium]HRJ98893.1 UDP-N-acetylmuramoyl-tripeptide--D-alanyl-D-alanine ligase [Ignavibacteria bacterium]
MLKLKDLLSVDFSDSVLEGLKTDEKFSGVSIDSRNVKRNEIFFAIKGENFDAHDFLSDVFKKGIKLAVVNWNWYKKNKGKCKGKSVIAVEDTVQALGQFAAKHRSGFSIPVFCIGGSNGKTTTKDLVSAVLSEKFNVLSTAGNLNNHIGLPLTLLKLNSSHDIAVLEVGCNHFKEVEYLMNIAKPEYGMVTNIGKEHLEFFKDLNGVAKAEFELYDYLEKNSGTAFMNFDDRYIRNKSKKIKKAKMISYSYGFRTDVTGSFEGFNKNYQPVIKVNLNTKSFKVTVSTFGKHSIYNGLAAVTAGLAFKVKNDSIKKALKNFRQSSSKRMEIIDHNGVKFINDSYNSNPESVRMGLETLLGFKSKGKKFAVLSDMLELGKGSAAEHSDIGRYAQKIGIKNLFTYGKHSLNTFKSAGKIKNNFYFNDKSDLSEMLKRNLRAGDVVYVKGSRGMKMEEVINKIIQN